MISNNSCFQEYADMIDQHFSVNQPSLMEMDSRDARLILATRSCLILRSARQDPMARLREYLLSDVVATRFALLMDVVQQIWPEPFGIHRPCCPNASLDEALLSKSVQLAIFEQRPTFDALLHEMLNSDARDLLYARARLLYRDVE
jgi:hypothetical protein